jgi:hypothetical protein
LSGCKCLNGIIRLAAVSAATLSITMHAGSVDARWPIVVNANRQQMEGKSQRKEGILHCLPNKSCLKTLFLRKVAIKVYLSDGQSMKHNKKRRIFQKMLANKL